MTIELVEPDPTWPRQFEEIGSTLQSAFGARALRIDHIGSTAVPGLLAKDVIDVQVTVEALDRRRRRHPDGFGLRGVARYRIRPSAGRLEPAR